MAASWVQDHTTGTSSTGTSVTCTLAAGVAAGHLIRIWVAMDNTGTATPTVTAVDKPGGETATWSQAAFHNSPVATSAGGVRGECWVIKTTQLWASGTVITVTLSASPPKSHALCQEFAGVIATLRSTSGTGTASAGLPSATTTGTAPQTGDLVLGGATFESSTTPGGDTTTVNGAWSTALTGNTGGGASAAQVSSIAQWKVPTAAGHQTYSPASPSADSGAAISCLQADPSATVSAATIVCTATIPAVTLAENAAVSATAVAAVAGMGAVTASGGGGGGGGGGTIVSRTATKAETASGQSITGTLPTDRVTGDYVVATFHMSTAVGSYTGPGGSWTTILGATANGLGQIVAVYGQFSPASAPTGTTTDAAGRQTCICQAYGVVDTTTPVDFTPAITASSATGPSVTIGAATIATAGARLLSGVTGNFSTGSWTQPTGMTLVMQHTSGTGRGGALADEAIASTGSTGTRQWTASVTQAVVGYLTALRPAAASGDATATPAALAAVTAMPAVSTGVSSTAQPATLAAVAGMAAVTASGAASGTCSPATLAATTAMGAVKRLFVFAGTTGTITGLQPDSSYQVTVRAVDAAGNRSADSASVTVTTGSPAVAVATLAAVAAVGAPTVRVSTTTAPNTLAAVASLPAVTTMAGGSATATPATLAAVAAVGAPVLHAGSTVTPATVAATTAVGAPTVTAGGGATATPATLAATATVGAPTVIVGGSRTPATIAAVAAMPAASVGGSAQVSPATLAATAAVGAAVLHTGSTVTPVTIAAITAVGAPTVTGGSSGAATPARIQAVAAIGAPAVTVSVLVSAQSVLAVASIGAPSLHYGSVVAVATLAARTTMALPVVQVKITYRPFTGTTSRPGSGTTARPYAGTTPRP